MPTKMPLQRVSKDPAKNTLYSLVNDLQIKLEDYADSQKGSFFSPLFNRYEKNAAVAKALIERLNDIDSYASWHALSKEVVNEDYPDEVKTLMRNAFVEAIYDLNTIHRLIDGKKSDYYSALSQLAPPSNAYAALAAWTQPKEIGDQIYAKLFAAASNLYEQHPQRVLLS